HPVAADVLAIAQNLGLKYHPSIIWQENNVSRRQAWGSFAKASAPRGFAPIEVILLLFKDSWDKLDKTGHSDITPEEFIDWSFKNWRINGESRGKKRGNPAAWPPEIPKRLIKMYSYAGSESVVLDPFVGSGTTLLVCQQLGRKGIGIDINCLDAARRNIAVDCNF